MAKHGQEQKADLHYPRGLFNYPHQSLGIQSLQNHQQGEYLTL